MSGDEVSFRKDAQERPQSGDASWGWSLGGEER